MKKGSGLNEKGTFAVPFFVGPDPFVEILQKMPLPGDGENPLAIDDRRPWTHLRLNIFPDGGVARLRVHGEAVIDWMPIAKAGRAIDLASILNGGLVLGASDMHYGARDNMIMPWPREEHGRWLGNQAPSRTGLRLGDRPARHRRLIRSRDRYEPLQGSSRTRRVT